MKEVLWDSSAKKTIRGFSDKVKRELGVLLLSLQRGQQLGMPQSRAMRAVHDSAFELRVKDKEGIYRVFYILLNKEKILVPHAFMKKTQQTPQKEIAIAKTRLRRLLDEN